MQRHPIGVSRIHGKEARVAGKTRRVVFARINRRPGQEPLQLRPFSEDLRRLAESRTMSHTQRRSGVRPERRWFAADMRVVPSEAFMVGTLGYAEKQTHVQFDEHSWSWIKGESRHDDAGSEQTVVPFAVDLRDGERWIAFATSGRMRPQQFASGLERVLNEAVIKARLVPVDWEVDLVTSEGRIDAWLADNPRVFYLRRTVKFSNPGRDLDEDRAQMRALHANRKSEEFAAPRGQQLQTDVAEFREKLEGTDVGFLDVILKARGSGGHSQAVFNSRNAADDTLIDEFGQDLERGMDMVLAALQGYLRTVRKQDGQGSAAREASSN